MVTTEGLHTRIPLEDRMPRPHASLALTVLLLLFAGCKEDPNTPAYWEKSLNQAKRAQDKVRLVESLRKSEHLDASFLPMLHAQLAEERSPETKAALARLLRDLKHPDSVGPLMSAVHLEATDIGMQPMNKELASALGAIGDKKAAPVLLRLLGAPDSFTRVEAVEALGRIRANEAVEPLIKLASDDGQEPFVNKKAIEALGLIGDTRAVPTLVRTITKERKGMSFYGESAFALFQMGQPAADALLAALEGRDKELSRWAQEQGINPVGYAFKPAQILGDMRDRRAEKALLRQLAFKHDNPRLQAIVRMHAADALAKMRLTSAVKPLSTMALDPDITMRQAYVYALVRLGGREALPVLEKAANQ
jgi:HEAT repeat protein